MIRVLVVDDSPSVCRVLAAFLRSDPGVAVAGTAHSGEAAIEQTRSLRPDVVTLDLEMPGIGGMAALDAIMTATPTPVVLLTGVSTNAAAATLEGLARGAVDFVAKYTPGKTTDPDELRATLLATIRVAAGVKVIRSLNRPATWDPSRATPLPRRLAPAPGRVVVIGASTGGPTAIRDVLCGLPADLPAAVVIIQHLPAAFTRPLAEQLSRTTPFRVREAAAGDRLEPGVALVAPGDWHLTVGADGRVELADGPKVSGHRPSIDVAFRSVAKVYASRAVGVLLTGMGEDGARGLAEVRAAGGRTFAQDAATSAVYGMPLRAVELGAVDEIDTPAGIAARVVGCFAGGTG